MFLVLLLFLAAMSLEGIGTYISVIGLSAAFAADPIILTMAVILDFSKIIAVSALSKKWAKLNAAIKVYLIASTIVLMTITSSGVAGYLSNSFQKAILPTQGNQIVLDNLVKEQQTLTERKKEIDKQISQLPANNVRGRQKLMAEFKPEADRINSRLAEIDAKLPLLQTQKVEQHSEVGPIIFLAEALGISVEKAVSIVIAMIIFVFDPLSIVFLITGNRLLNVRAEEKKQEEEEKRSHPVEPLIPFSNHETRKDDTLQTALEEAGWAPVKDNYPAPEWGAFDDDLAVDQEITRQAVREKHLEELTRLEEMATGQKAPSVEEPAPFTELPEDFFKKLPQGQDLQLVPIEEPKVIVNEPTSPEVPPIFPLDPKPVVEQVQEEPQKEYLDEVLKQIHSYANGTLSGEDKQRLEQAIDRIFTPQAQETPPVEAEPEQVEEIIPHQVASSDAVPVAMEEDLEIQQDPKLEEPEAQIESEQALNDLVHGEISTIDYQQQPKSALDDPSLNHIKGANHEFVGPHWINPKLQEIYGDQPAK